MWLPLCIGGLENCLRALLQRIKPTLHEFRDIYKNHATNKQLMNIMDFVIVMNRFIHVYVENYGLTLNDRTMMIELVTYVTVSHLRKKLFIPASFRKNREYSAKLISMRRAIIKDYAVLLNLIRPDVATIAKSLFADGADHSYHFEWMRTPEIKIK